MQGGAVTVLEKPCQMDTLIDTIKGGLCRRAAIMKTRQNRSQKAARHSGGRPSSDRALSPQMVDYERELISRALKHNAGNKVKTAGELGISKSQLYAKLKSFGLT
jgi:DNA-binding NtrC family response regulator